jgi:glycosyltransferase involved in cell wall biosynthesis
MYNVACVLRAFRLIQKKYPEAELTIIGCGSQEAFLKSFSRNLKLKNVAFLGKVSWDRIAKYYRKADFMLNASNIDNLPMSILEAFSSGIPVISTAAGGIPYMIEDSVNGLVVPLDDEKAMAEKAICLLENQVLARSIAKRAREDCTKNYSWDTNRGKWLSIYGVAWD